uniref:Peroxiredoxin-like 2A n=1 Tax=Branchiostoma floridae TaxID=7739 RepID=C3Z6F4_BRAFL|eukprot:XP_002595886.1 hypothetical protein BRAFLDRAFT_62377 [Branchiostoma floridae]
MGWVVNAVGVAVVGMVAVNLNFWLPKHIPAQLAHIADAALEELDGNKKKLQAQELWKNHGAVIMAEALGLSSLKPQLDRAGVPLYAVVHERKGVPEFQPYFQGKVFLDLERRFYGPHERWMSLAGLLRVNFWLNIRRVMEKKVEGNYEGEGRLLGGVFVVGSGNQGILMQHAEQEFGHHANLTDIMKAVEKIQHINSKNKI